MITVPSLYDICAGIVIKDVFGDNLAVSNQLLPKTIIQDLNDNTHYFKSITWEQRYGTIEDIYEPQILDLDAVLLIISTLHEFEPEELLDFDHSFHIYNEAPVSLERIICQVTSYDYIETDKKGEETIHKICQACAEHINKYNSSTNNGKEMIERIDLQHYDLRFILNEHCNNYSLICKLCFRFSRCIIKILRNKFKTRSMKIEPTNKNIRKMGTYL